MDRYHRQSLLPQIGSTGQERLRDARVLVIGCGALGTVICEQLVRAGVGSIRITDRDVVELTNLQRQVLFDESDARANTPKAIAAAQRLRQVNSTVQIEPVVVDVNSGNIEELAGCERNATPVDLIIDGTDNAETRYLLNDMAVKHSLPWIYGACIGTEGRVMTIHSPRTACLRCLFPTPPAAGELPTCDTVGVLGPAASIVASLQAVAAIRFLVSDRDAPANTDLLVIDVWANRFKNIGTNEAKRPDCTACGERNFEFLDRLDAGTVSLCGRNAIQVRPPRGSAAFDLSAVATRLSAVAPVERTPFLVKCALPAPENLQLTLFPDGRLIVGGTSDANRAKSIYSRYVGT